MRTIVVVPFSNNLIRDWPVGHFARLVDLLLTQLPEDIRIDVVGTRGQRSAANAIVREHAPARVRNLCGHLAWEEVVAQVRAAACLIGNNSGLAHLAALARVPTVCVFGGSHQRTEWGPLGPTSIILSRQIGCSPCQFNHIWECGYGVACLRDIAPEEVADAVLAALASTHDGDPAMLEAVA
jgi:ADP-heptose:LPS heptosyltransferase